MNEPNVVPTAACPNADKSVCVSADSVSVKDVIRSRRLARGLNQLDLASASGIGTAEFVSMLETGHRRVHPNKAVAMAAALGVDEMDFCKLVVYERYPKLYAALYGPGCPQSPRVLDPRA